MREIKFRAWSKEYKGMYYTKRDNSDYCWMKREYAAFVFEIGFSGYESDQIEIMQFTGLHDKNDKEIYEGDIYQWFGFEAKNGKQIRVKRINIVKFEINDLYYLSNRINQVGVEIIGNIYENKELIEHLSEEK